MVRSKGEAVEFNCNATGNPIIIVWKRKPRNEEKNLTINMEGIHLYTVRERREGRKEVRKKGRKEERTEEERKEERKI